MEKKPIVRKSMGVFIVLLFVGISLAPMMSGLSIEKSIWDVQLCEKGIRDENDTTPPVTIATMEPEYHIGWYPLPVWVTLNATDNESGVNVTYYKIDNGGWGNYTHPIRIDTDGVFVVQFYSVDNAGNAEVPKQVEIKIDDAPPILHAFFDPPVPNGMNGWYIGNLWLILNATDIESGVSYIYCSASPGGIYTEPVLITGEGAAIAIKVYAVDYVYNRTPEGVIPSIKIDKTPPIIAMNYTWEKEGAVYNIIVTATCSDAMSGMAKVEFYFNGELQQTILGAGPDYIWTYRYTPLQNVIIRGVAYDNAGLNNSAELYNPQSSSAQSYSHVIQFYILRYQLMRVFLL